MFTVKFFLNLFMVLVAYAQEHKPYVPERPMAPSVHPACVNLWKYTCLSSESPAAKELRDYPSLEFLRFKEIRETYIREKKYDSQLRKLIEKDPLIKSDDGETRQSYESLWRLRGGRAAIEHFITHFLSAEAFTGEALRRMSSERWLIYGRASRDLEFELLSRITEERWGKREVAIDFLTSDEGRNGMRNLLNDWLKATSAPAHIEVSKKIYEKNLEAARKSRDAAYLKELEHDKDEYLNPQIKVLHAMQNLIEAATSSINKEIYHRIILDREFDRKVRLEFFNETRKTEFERQLEKSKRAVSMAMERLRLPPLSKETLEVSPHYLGTLFGASTDGKEIQMGVDIKVRQFPYVLSHELGHVLERNEGSRVQYKTKLDSIKTCLQTQNSAGVSTEQIAEATADWIGAEAIASMLSDSFETLTQEQKEELVMSSIISCRPQDQVPIGDNRTYGLTKEAHPLDELRANRILMAHPLIRRVFGCSTQNSPKYCE